MDIQVTVEPDPRALARAAWYQFRTNVQWVRGVGLALAVVALWAVLTPGWRPIGIVAVLVGAAFQVVPGLLVRRGVKERIRNSFGPVTLTFTEQGIGASSAIQTSQTAWRAFSRIVDTGDDLILTMVTGRVMAVPREVFTPEQFDELTAFLSGQNLLAGPKR